MGFPILLPQIFVPHPSRGTWGALVGWLGGDTSNGDVMRAVHHDHELLILVRISD